METIGKIAAVLAMIASICTITGVSIWGVVPYVCDKNNDNIEVQSLTDEDSSGYNTHESGSGFSEEIEEYFAGSDNAPNIDLYSNNDEEESEDSSLKETEEHSVNIESFSGTDIQSNDNMMEKTYVEEEIKEIKNNIIKYKTRRIYLRNIRLAIKLKYIM